MRSNQSPGHRASRPTVIGAVVLVVILGSWMTVVAAGAATTVAGSVAPQAPRVSDAAPPVAYGALKTVLSGPFLATGIAADAAGDVYMTYSGSGEVVEVHHGQTEAVPLITNVISPNDVAVDAAGDLFVTDHDQNRVVERRAGGGETVLPFTGLNAPTGVAVDASGDVFVSDTDRLLELPKGGSQEVLPVGLVAESASIATDAAGDVYVVEINQNKVVELAKEGTQTTVPLTGLNFPQSVAVDAAGDVFVVNGDDQVLELSSGGIQTVLGFPAPNAMNNVAVDGAGDVFVTFEHNLVEELAAGSATATVFPPNATATPSGLAADRAGDVFIADPDNEVVLERTPGGLVSRLLFTGLDAPSGVAVDQAGDVFVADGGDHQVVELTKGGAQVTLPFHGLTGPNGVAVDNGGDVFVTGGSRTVSIFGSSTVTPEVVELPADGAQVTLPFTGLSNPGSVAVDDSGDLFVADSGVYVLGLGFAVAPKVVELPHGGVATTIATPDLPDVSAVALDQAGDLFIGGSLSNESGTVGVVELPRGAPATAAGERDFNIPEADSLAVDGSGDLFASLGFSNQVQELPIDQALFTNPVNGQLNVDTTMPFTWSTIPAAQGYYLTVGTTLYGKDLVDSGILAPSQSSLAVPDLPSGELLFATLYTEEGGVWTRLQVVGFTAGHVASFTNPRNLEANVDPTIPFTWTPDSSGQGYILVVGTSPFGHNLVDSGPLPAGQTSYVVPPLPNGILYATLLTKINGAYTRYQAIRFTG